MVNDETDDDQYYLPSAQPRASLNTTVESPQKSPSPDDSQQGTSNSKEGHQHDEPTSSRLLTPFIKTEQSLSGQVVQITAVLVTTDTIEGWF